MDEQAKGAWQSRRRAMAAMAMACGGAALLETRNAQAEPEEEVSHSADAIHQETVFKASRQRVYEALTDTTQFDKVIQLGSGDSKALGSEATHISKEAGGAFVLFGGHIFGRQIELRPSERIVEAWRVADWAPGIYSIARFELKEDGGGTRVVFDHTGFPKGLGPHLAAGWRGHYWEPLAKFLS
ncbi:MAG: SRPBCC domain-containing protein [Terracidiphilus sp.]